MFNDEPDINAYDEGFLDTGMPMHMLIDIAYKRLSGGYKLTDKSRRGYTYAEKYGDTELLDFLRRKIPF